MSPHRVIIDRLVLTDLEVPFGDAERLRDSVSREMAQILARETWPRRHSGEALGRIVAPDIDLPGATTERQAAATVARSLAHALLSRDASRPEGRGDG